MSSGSASSRGPSQEDPDLDKTLSTFGKTKDTAKKTQEQSVVAVSAGSAGSADDPAADPALQFLVQCRFQCSSLGLPEGMMDRDGNVGTFKNTGTKVNPMWACKPCALAHFAMNNFMKKVSPREADIMRSVRDGNWGQWCEKIRSIRVNEDQVGPGIASRCVRVAGATRVANVSKWVAELVVSVEASAGRGNATLSGADVDEKVHGVLLQGHWP